MKEIAIIDAAIVERNQGDGFSDLSEERKAFAYNYVSNGYDHREAAILCGFSVHKGIQLKREPLVAAFIEYLQTQSYQANIVTREFVDARLDELEDIALGKVPIPIILANGEQIYREKFHGELAMSIVKERNKMQGYVRDETGKVGDVNIQINNNAVTGEVETKVITDQDD